MIIDLFLPLSLIFIMFTLGIGLTFKDFTNLLHNPKAFFIGVVNQMVILPIALPLLEDHQDNIQNYQTLIFVCFYQKFFLP